jgi:hypothetical protein
MTNEPKLQPEALIRGAIRSMAESTPSEIRRALGDYSLAECTQIIESMKQLQAKLKDDESPDPRAWLLAQAIPRKE